jgi:hypothetical protein
MEDLGKSLQKMVAKSNQQSSERLPDDVEHNPDYEPVYYLLEKYSRTLMMAPYHGQPYDKTKYKMIVWTYRKKLYNECSK